MPPFGGDMSKSTIPNVSQGFNEATKEAFLARMDGEFDLTAFEEPIAFHLTPRQMVLLLSRGSVAHPMDDDPSKDLEYYPEICAEVEARLRDGLPRTADLVRQMAAEFRLYDKRRRSAFNTRPRRR